MLPRLTLCRLSYKAYYDNGVVIGPSNLLESEKLRVRALTIVCFFQIATVELKKNLFTNNDSKKVFTNDWFVLKLETS